MAKFSVVIAASLSNDRGRNCWRTSKLTDFERRRRMIAKFRKEHGRDPIFTHRFQTSASKISLSLLIKLKIYSETELNFNRLARYFAHA